MHNLKVDVVLCYDYNKLQITFVVLHQDDVWIFYSKCYFVPNTVCSNNYKKGNFEWEIYLTKQKQVAISNGTEK